MLAQFDAVLILERLEASLRQLYHRLGWCAASTPIHRHRSKEPPLEMDAAAVGAFMERNRPDVELYAFADRLAAAFEEDTPPVPAEACGTTDKPPAPDLLAATTETGVARPVYFLHFQRVGGGSLCHIARQDNRLAAPEAARTCALEGDGPKTLAPSDGNAAWATAEGCAERAAATSQYQFFAVERWFDLEYFASVECRAKFFFVTSLREPLTRIASHLAKVGASVEEGIAWASRTHVETIGRGTAAVDNFYTRSLLGRQAFHGIEAGNVTMSDADRAFDDVLKQFDAVLILERLAISFRQLASKLDWCLPKTLNLCDLRPRHCPAYTNLDEVRGAFGALNAPDAALYVKADRLAAALERDLPLPRRCTARDELWDFRP